MAKPRIITHDSYNTKKETGGLPSPLLYVEKDGQLVRVSASLFGSIQVLLGTDAENTANLVYDFQKLYFKNKTDSSMAGVGAAFRLDLETGRNQIVPDFATEPIWKEARLSWFPGALSYGFIKSADANIYDAVQGGQVIGTVPRWAQDKPITDSIIQIKTCLDDVNTSPNLKKGIRYQIKYKDKIGYIYATAVDIICYKANETNLPIWSE